MSRQNIYDNEKFFQNYQTLRKKTDSANVLFELPALLSLLPDFSGKAVLDLGCGFGEHCQLFVEKGAERVVGIDISEKMLALAIEGQVSDKITYKHLAMEEIDQLDEKFDLIVSSLAFHYVEDFQNLLFKIYTKLNDGGYLVFSQEHPINTCHSGGDRWIRDEDGKKQYCRLSHYGLSGKRETAWFVDGVQKYHRTFSQIINNLIATGFSIEKIIEPLPTPEILENFPDYEDLYHKPDFLLIKARKLKRAGAS